MNVNIFVSNFCFFATGFNGQVTMTLTVLKANKNMSQLSWWILTKKKENEFFSYKKMFNGFLKNKLKYHFARGYLAIQFSKKNLCCFPEFVRTN